MSAASILDLLAQIVSACRGPRVPLLGVAGAQGSGKSFHAHAFVRANPRVAHFSLDDVYLPRSERRRLAETIPLFITRGPPGTHDLDLALRTIERLNRAGPDDATPLPRFDKARDERTPEPLWPRFVGRPDAILIDGWCLGATLFSKDRRPLNALEAEDSDGRWRAAIAEALERCQPFFASFDAIVYLLAPSFEIVRRWRGEQEAKMLGRPLDASENAALDRFVQHYERITRAMLNGEHCSKWILHLDDARQIISFEHETP